MPLSPYLQIVIGAGLGVLAILPFARRGDSFLRGYFAITLFAAAAIYFVFAAAGMFSDTATYGFLGFETAGVLLFSIVADVGWKISPGVLALGWLAHIYWDAGFHGRLQTPYVPEQYPGICIGFDFVFGAFIVY